MASTKGTSKQRRSRGTVFGPRIREARERLGLSVAAAARKAKVSVNTFYAWESNDRVPADFVKLARVMETTVAELYGEVGA